LRLAADAVEVRVMRPASSLRVELGFVRLTGFFEALFGSLASRVMWKSASLNPLAQECTVVHLAAVGYVRRHHQ